MVVGVGVGVGVCVCVCVCLEKGEEGYVWYGSGSGFGWVFESICVLVCECVRMCDCGSLAVRWCGLVCEWVCGYAGISVKMLACGFEFVRLDYPLAIPKFMCVWSARVY